MAHVYYEVTKYLYTLMCTTEHNLAIRVSFFYLFRQTLRRAPEVFITHQFDCT